MSDDEWLEDVERRVAEREPVDWEAVQARLDAVEASPEQREALSLLRVLDEVGSLHSSLQTSEVDGVSTIPAPDPVADDTLQSWGRYLLDGKVGRGGFGSVYRAWDPVLEMSVAIKILHRRFSDDRLKERLVQEGRALAQIRHTNVVSVLNVEQHDGRLGLVMEFISGETLDALVARQGKLNEREASIIAEDVCRALEAVHAKELIHRDVKARNIIREQAGRIVLMDFGAGLPTNAVQEKGRAVGTPLYMAPENLAGHPATVMSDVYSVGVLLFYLVTGRHPYEGNTVDEIREAQATGPPQSVLRFRPDLPTRFVSVVDRALAVDPKVRFQTPSALIHGLVELRDTTPIATANTRRSWGQRVMRGGVALAVLSLITTMGGLLSWATFNLTLGRGEFADDTPLDWLVLGYRALVLPVFLSLLAMGAIAVLIAVRRVLLTTSSALRSVDARLGRGCVAFARRLSLHDPAVCVSWLFLATAFVLAVIWWHWAVFLQAVTTYVATASPELMAVLSKPFIPFRSHYRVALCFLFAANVGCWYGLTRLAGARGVPMPRWGMILEFSLLVLLFISMQLPFRISHEDDGYFPVLSWSDAQCFVVGERPADVLLVCPAVTPRHHTVQRKDLPAPVSSSKANLFDALAALRSRRP
jgi:predicted Ser/Thr protein kinase